MPLQYLAFFTVPSLCRPIGIEVNVETCKYKVINFRCTSCVSSNWDCSWCPTSATCVSSETCDINVISSYAVCPVITRITNAETPKFVGRRTTFLLQTERLPQVLYFVM